MCWEAHNTMNKCDNPEDKRDKIVAIPVSQAEHDLIKHISRTEGFSMASICRNCVLDYAHSQGYADTRMTGKGDKVSNFGYFTGNRRNA